MSPVASPAPGATTTGTSMPYSSAATIAPRATIASASPSTTATGAVPARIASANTYELELDPRPDGIESTTPASMPADLRVVRVDQARRSRGRGPPRS